MTNNSLELFITNDSIFMKVINSQSSDYTYINSLHIIYRTLFVTIFDII